jgi:hypothetical protein
MAQLASRESFFRLAEPLKTLLVRPIENVPIWGLVGLAWAKTKVTNFIKKFEISAA